MVFQEPHVTTWATTESMPRMATLYSHWIIMMDHVNTLNYPINKKSIMNILRKFLIMALEINKFIREKERYRH